MSITAKELAELAGVSRGTVDRALKNRPDISPETKARILALAKKYNYTPNLIGKALVHAGKALTVPVLLNSIGNPFFSAVKEGLFAAQSAYSDYGISLKLTEFKGYSPERLLALLNALPEDIGGLIVTPIADERVEEKLRSLTENGVQVVMLTGKLMSMQNAIYIGCDYLKSGRIAGRLVGLLSGGRANLFIVTGSVHHKGHAQRIEGIESVLKQAYPDIRLLGVSENLDDDEVAYSAMKKALRQYPETDFVYITAGGVNGTLRALGEHKGKITVCTFDDTPVVRAALRDGKISATICQQPYEQGYRAVKAIAENAVLQQPLGGDIYSELSIKVDQSI